MPDILTRCARSDSVGAETARRASPVHPPGPHHNTAPHHSPPHPIRSLATARSLIPRTVSSLDGASDSARHRSLVSASPILKGRHPGDRAVRRTRSVARFTEPSEARFSLFHPCFCREWCPQRAKRARTPEREKDGLPDGVQFPGVQCRNLDAAADRTEGDARRVLVGRIHTARQAVALVGEHFDHGAVDEHSQVERLVVR